MSGKQELNFSKINVVANRTSSFHLEYIPGNPIDKLCNRKDLWPKDWVKWKNHGFKLSYDGTNVEIETSYNKGM